MLTGIALLATLASATVQEHPRGLYATKTHWFYFPNKRFDPDGPYLAQTFIQNHMIMIRGLAKDELDTNARGEQFGPWFGRETLINYSNNRTVIDSVSKLFSFEQNDVEATGEAFFSVNGDSYVASFSNKLGSIKFQEQMNYVSDTTVDFFSGTWSGAGVKLSIQQQGKEITGTANYKGGDYVVKGTRFGSTAQIDIVDMDRNQFLGGFSLAWNPTASDIRAMFAGAKPTCNRLTMLEYVKDRDIVVAKDVTRG